MKKKIFLLLSFFFCLNSNALCWGPITHYHINREAAGISEVFNQAGTYPDAFNFFLTHWIYVAHSPGPVNKEFKAYGETPFPYVDRPNMGYILGKVAKNKDQRDMADGWAGHIAADWVAHDLLLIPDFGQLESVKAAVAKALVFLGHVTTEGTVDIYNFYKRGPMNTKFRVFPEQIWKGFVNWQLIDMHEARIKLPVEEKNGKFVRGDIELCVMAVKNHALTCPKEDQADIEAALSFLNNPTNSSIKPFLIQTAEDRITDLGKGASSEQNAIRIVGFLFPEAIHALIVGVELLGIEDFLSNSKQAFSQWLANKDGQARGIPAPYNPVHPLSPAKLLAKTFSDATASDFIPKINGEEISPDELSNIFWQDVAKKALQYNALETVKTEGTDANGVKFIDVETVLKDETLFKQAFSEVVTEYAANENYVISRYGKWTKRVFLEGQLDPDIILDFDLPVVSILSPSDSDIVNANPLVISGNVSDKNFLSYTLDFGAGDNPATFTKICDGTQAVQEGTLCSWDTTNLSGTYTLRLSALDKNDNENITTTKVFIGNPVFITAFGHIGKKPGEFKEPSGLSLDAQENIYIADTENDRIQKMDKNFTFLMQIGGKDKKEKDDENDHDKRLLKEPEGVFVDTQGNIFVADTEHHTVKKFDASGALLLTIGKKSTGKHDEDEEGKNNGEFNQPVGVAVSTEGNIYVTDSQNDRIQVFDATGAFQFLFGSHGESTGQFNKPTGIALDAVSNIFVADTENNRIQMFTKDGQFVFAANHDAFKHPEAVFMDTQNNIYIADTFHQRIIKADRFGNVLFLLGTKGNDPSQFNQPRGLAVTSDASILYVCDTLNHRIQKFQIKVSASPPVVAKTNDDDKKETTPVSDDGTLVKAIMNAPNPVRGDVIRFLYKLTGKGKQKAKEGMLSVHVEVYSLTGKRIASFDCNASDESCNWQQSLSNGVYVYRLTLSEAGGQTESKVGKLVVVR